MRENTRGNRTDDYRRKCAGRYTGDYTEEFAVRFRAKRQKHYGRGPSPQLPVPFIPLSVSRTGFPFFPLADFCPFYVPGIVLPSVFPVSFRPGRALQSGGMPAAQLLSKRHGMSFPPG